MNLILDSHPKIWALDEDQYLFISIYLYLSAPIPGAPSFVSFKLPDHAHILPFIKMLPGCRVLWCIRDPLDVVWSMMKLRIPYKNINIPWPAHPGGGRREIENSFWVLSDLQREELSGHMHEYGIVINKLMHILQNSPENDIEIAREDLVLIAALCWRIKNELPSLYKAHDIDFHVVRYEDLVTSPKDQIAETLNFIGADWSDKVIMHHRLHDGKSIGNTVNTRAIDQNSLGLGKNNLSQEEQDLIKKICGKTAKHWHYDLN